MEKFKKSFNEIVAIIMYILIFFGLGTCLNEILFNTIEDMELVMLLSNLIPYTLIFITAIVLLRFEIKTDFTRLNKSDAMTTFRIVIMGLGMAYMGNYIGSLISTLLGGGVSGNQQAVDSVLLGKYGFIFAFITIFIGPIVEELIFRKSIHGALRKFNVNPSLILVISSVLFGLLHVVLNGDFVNIFPYIGMGLALGWMETKTRNVMPSIFAHMTINAIAVIMTMILFKIQPFLPQI